MNTAIVGYINKRYHVLAAWDATTIISRENQIKVRGWIPELSRKHPSVPYFSYIVSSKLLIPGDTFERTQWDEIVINSEVHFSQQQQQWQGLDCFEVQVASVQARRDLGL